MLNLENVIINEREEHDADYVLHAESQKPARNCPECNSTNAVSIGSREQRIRDTSMHGKRVIILFKRKRLRCKDCSKTFFEPLTFLDEDYRMTKRCVEYIVNRSYSVPFLHVASDIGVDEKTIRNIFATHVQALESKYWYAAPRVLGIDETHLNKVMRLVLTNIEELTLVNLKRDRSKKTVKDAICRLYGWQGIEIVTMDMWRPYRDAVRDLLPDAVIIIDRFHVAKFANEAMDQARKDVRSQLEKRERIKLKNDRKILFKRRDDIKGLNELASFEFWTHEYPDLMAVYNAKEGFLGLWDMPDRESAEEYWQNWLEVTPKPIKRYFSEAIRAIGNWHDEIFNWWNFEYTNAFTESLNNLIKSVHRSGRGYSFDVLRAKMLFTKGALAPVKPKSPVTLKKRKEAMEVNEEMLKYDVIILDECHRSQTYGSRLEQLQDLFDQAIPDGIEVICSGTPVVDN
ncbi:ISL3 family transposase [Vibrio splendidus]